MWHAKEFVPEGIKSYLRLVSAKLRFPGCFIGSHLVGRQVVLGRGCSVSPGAQLANGVRLGDYSYVNHSAIVASGEFGRFCSVGPYALIGMPEHPTNFLSTSPNLYGARNLFGAASDWNDFPDPPRIGSDVWIGAFSFIRQGVEIGHGAVIGAGSVVTHNVPPYAIVGGVPARVIRFRFDPDTVNQLLATRWWEQSTDELAKDAERFLRPWTSLAASEATR